MSRSYKKPWKVDGYGTKNKTYYKNQANKTIRHLNTNEFTNNNLIVILIENIIINI